MLVPFKKKRIHPEGDSGGDNFANEWKLHRSGNEGSYEIAEDLWMGRITTSVVKRKGTFSGLSREEGQDRKEKRSEKPNSQRFKT